jgi:hypothetical protein
MQHLWQVLLQATESRADRLSCDECFLLIDYLSDLLASGYSPRSVLPLAERYLDQCPDCDDEYVKDLEELLAPVHETG